jgi:hypothetical protein
MASLTYVDDVFAQKSVSDVTFSLVDSESPTDALDQAARIAQLLLLSNHIDHAYALLCALHKHQATIEPRPESDVWRLKSQVFGYFWHTHPELSRPGEAVQYHNSLENQQWNEYRETTRTGWMLEHCSLPEPEDPHVWRETDDPAMIAMCSRLLAKNKNPGEYPPQEQMREALEAAKKLYAQPQVPITEWKHKWEGSRSVRRHSYLLYRRLVVELAIRVGELQTAADILSMGLTIDGFNSMDGGQLDRYLYLPGIYDVLPLLASKGKAGNPYYIEEPDAAAMVAEITAALESRAENGRQWSLAPEKVGWRELLDRLAKGAWIVNQKAYREMGLESAVDVLHKPASEKKIAAAEQEFGELPADFKEMVRIANGFYGGWHFLEGGIEGIKNMDWAEDDLDNYESDLANGMFAADIDEIKYIQLSPAVECDGFRHNLIPPATWRRCFDDGREFKEGEYCYWHTASWRCEAPSWPSVRDWVASLVEQVERQVKDKETVDDDEPESEE